MASNVFQKNVPSSSTKMAPFWGLFCGAEGSREPFFSSLRERWPSRPSRSRTRSPRYICTCVLRIGTKSVPIIKKNLYFWKAIRAL